jgi:hypothetical protein
LRGALTPDQSSVTAAMRLFDKTTLYFQISKQILFREQAEVRVLALSDLFHPVGIANVAAADGHQIEFRIVETA